MKKNRSILTLFLTLAITTGCVMNETPSGEETNEAKNANVSLDKIEQAMSYIQAKHINEVTEEQLLEGAINGVLSSLDDPYSEYLDVETMQSFTEQLESSFQGIGAEVSQINGVVTIVSPIKDSPAEKAGLRPNDQIISIDGESIEGLDLQEAVSKIRGEKGTDVTIEIKRANSDTLIPFTITRDEIPLETVYPELIENAFGKIGYLEVTSFSENTADDFSEGLEKLEEDDIAGLIIDVRGNPGGLLDQVEKMLTMFIPSDRPYMQIEDGNGEKQEYFSDLKEEKDYPISVLVDEGSASASEILAVSLKEAIDAEVVGVTSFGKGTVQEIVELGDGSSIKLTTFNWLSSEGTSIHEVGVEPTVEVMMPDYYYASPIVLNEGEISEDHVSDQVVFMQQMLFGLSYDIDRTDGYFSKDTKAALLAFQKDQGLEETGILNDDTAARLEMMIVERVRAGEDDLQKQKAVDLLLE